jgi:hypothetical protein
MSRLASIERGRAPALNEAARFAELYGIEWARLVGFFGADETLPS